MALKRNELIDLTCHLGVSIKKYFKKQRILDQIIVNLVDNKTLEEETLEYVSKQEVSEIVKIKQMELELQRETETEGKKLVRERELRREIDEREREKERLLREKSKKRKSKIREKEM